MFSIYNIAFLQLSPVLSESEEKYTQIKLCLKTVQNSYKQI